MILNILMGDEKINGFSLENFAQLYFSYSIVLAENHISLDEYNENIIMHVQRETKIPRDHILKLHHPLHWILFNEKDAPLKSSPKTKGRADNLYISLKNGVPSINELTERLMQRHGELLEAKLKKITQHKSQDFRASPSLTYSPDRISPYH